MEYKGSTQGDQFGIYCDLLKIKQDLNWEPKITFSEGIREMINWALKECK